MCLQITSIDNDESEEDLLTKNVDLISPLQQLNCLISYGPPKCGVIPAAQLMEESRNSTLNYHLSFLAPINCHLGVLDL